MLPLKIVFFKNNSGDAPYPLFMMSDSDTLSDAEIESLVKQMIGDDYDADEDIMYGKWYIVDISNLKMISNTRETSKHIAHESVVLSLKTKHTYPISSCSFYKNFKEVIVTDWNGFDVLLKEGEWKFQERTFEFFSDVDLEDSNKTISQRDSIHYE